MDKIENEIVYLVKMFSDFNGKPLTEKKENWLVCEIVEKYGDEFIVENGEVKTDLNTYDEIENLIINS